MKRIGRLLAQRAIWRRAWRHYSYRWVFGFDCKREVHMMIAEERALRQAER